MLGSGIATSSVDGSKRVEKSLLPKIGICSLGETRGASYESQNSLSLSLQLSNFPGTLYFWNKNTTTESQRQKYADMYVSL